MAAEPGDYPTEQSRAGGEHRKFNPDQPRDPGGEDGGQWTSSPTGALKDALKLAGKIDLGPDEKLLGSDRVNGSGGSVRIAVTELDGKRSVRLGLGSELFGGRYDPAGPWRGNRDRSAATKAERERLRNESVALDEELADTTDPARKAAIQKRLDAIDEQLGEAVDDEAAGYTAKLDQGSAERLRSTLADALAAAKKKQAEVDAAYDKGEAEPPRPEQGYWTFAQGSIPGEWADIYYDVEFDDPDVGVEVYLGAVPHGSGETFDDLRGSERVAKLDPAEARKFLRLLAAVGATSRNLGVKGAPVLTRAFQPEDHPRAPAGSDTGGEFAKAGATVGKSAKSTVKSAKSRTPRRPMKKPDDGTLAYDPGSNQGTGYGSREGDERVHALQQALNRLGVKDAAGKPLRDDGKLGPKTTAAVKAMQRMLGMKPDGKVTPALLAHIKSMKSLPMKRSSGMDICVRSFGFEPSAKPGDGRTLEGYAAVFNSPARIAALGGDFEETILPGAFKRSLATRTPILQWDHGKDPRIGTAPIGDIEELREDNHGLYVRARLYDHPDIERVRLGIQGRSIRGMSFRFGVPTGGDEWPSHDKRNVRDLDAYELGPVAFPAYDTTTVSVRSLLAQLGPEEHLALLRELAHDLRSVDLTDLVGQSSARSADGDDIGDDEPGSAVEPALSSIDLRLQEQALRALGVLSG